MVLSSDGEFLADEVRRSQQVEVENAPLLRGLFYKL